MAKNTGTGTRVGVITNRTQTYNNKTKQFIKRDAGTGKFLATKDQPFKNVRKDPKAKDAAPKAPKPNSA
jgi:hypothetical protein